MPRWTNVGGSSSSELRLLHAVLLKCGIARMAFCLFARVGEVHVEYNLRPFSMFPRHVKAGVALVLENLQDVA